MRSPLTVAPRARSSRQFLRACSEFPAGRAPPCTAARHVVVIARHVALAACWLERPARVCAAPAAEVTVSVLQSTVPGATRRFSPKPGTDPNPVARSRRPGPGRGVGRSQFPASRPASGPYPYVRYRLAGRGDIDRRPVAGLSAVQAEEGEEPHGSGHFCRHGPFIVHGMRHPDRARIWKDLYYRLSGWASVG
jgi:hypothetical protein